jgi:hypothetical protein
VTDEGIAAAHQGRAPAAVALIGVYRRQNAVYVLPVVETAEAAGWQSAWWALDAEAERLAGVTVGSGPGEKLPLLNAIIARAGIPRGWLVVADDDVVFTRGDVVGLVALCAEGGFDLAQPARSDDNSRYEYNVAHRITTARHMSRARATTFVEIGPLFVVGPRWWHRIVPFPESRGMGWGLELDWHELYQEGCRLGIIDAIRIAHEGEPGRDYDFERQAERMHAELADRGYEGWADVQRTLAVWRPWQRVPPWSRAQSRALARAR